MQPIDIEKFLSEKTKWHSELEVAIRQTFSTYFSNIDEQLLSSEEIENDIQDHVVRRYEKTLIHYIPWVMKVFDLSDKEIVEIGCGTGSSTAAFSHFCQHIYAYEVDNTSILAAKARMRIMGINNVSIIQSEPDSLLEKLQSNHSSGVSVILLFAVLEHTTIQERLEILKTCWNLLLPDGILIVAETPNRLTYYDYHTSWLPFFHFLPLDLAVEYYHKSPRDQFKLAVQRHLDEGKVEDAKNTLVRWGNAVSYHEFEIALGVNLEVLLIADGDAEEMRSLYPVSHEEKLLQQYFIEAKINQPLAFTNKILNLIFQKKSFNRSLKTRNQDKSISSINCTNSFAVRFNQRLREKFPQSVARIALLVTPEYEGIFRNGGIGSYYRTLSEKLVAENWYVILLLCQSQEKFGGESHIPVLKHIFSSSECQQLLELKPFHSAILSRYQDSDWVEYENYCALFFTQAIVSAFSNALVYVEFPEMLGLGYRTIQAKRTGVLGRNCIVAVTLHSGQEWLHEANEKYTPSANWFRQTCHYEQYSFEQADLAFYLSHFLKDKVEKYGWKTSHALYLPYCFPIIEQLLEKAEPFRNNLQCYVNTGKIPLIFFGRLEERKGLVTFLEALQLLETDARNKVQIIFLGKTVQLQAENIKHLDSQQYIQQQLGDDYDYHIVTDLFSREAIQLVNQLNHPIVCLTSLQENFPNSALEMGQLPVSLVVSDTGGFRETLNLIERSDGVHWFQPGDGRSLAHSLEQAISAYPENPSTPKKDFLQQVNQRLLNLRSEYMNCAFYRMVMPISIENNRGVLRQWILGMTSPEEQVFLENYAQNDYFGQGEIVELGCWLGSSTISLARGLADNSRVTEKNQRIHAYDIFIWHSKANMQQSVIGTALEGKYKDGDNFLDEYLQRISPWHHLIRVCPGDLREVSWNRGAIEFLFIDAMKSWDLANSILKNFFPNLIPEISLVVHQDFAHSYTFWIPLLMYRLREYLIPLDFPKVYPSKIFRYIKSIPEELLQYSYSIASFSEEEVEAAFSYALAITPPKMQANILAAKVMYFIQVGNLERAKLELKQATANLNRCQWLELGIIKERFRI